jgi:predicted membrane GTPase involved in stress response
VREKKLTNIRTTAADEKVFLQPPKRMTLEDAIGTFASHPADAYVEGAYVRGLLTHQVT